MKSSRVKSSRKKKFYVVWEGRQTGVFADWASCQAQVKGFAGAKFKSFSSLQEAQHALVEGHQEHVAPKKLSNSPTPKQPTSLPNEVIQPSWAVDGACQGNPGKMEYRIVTMHDGETLYHSEIFPKGTNNIGEFLALTRALKLSQQASVQAIYTDSRTALAWLRNAKARTTLLRDSSTEVLWQEIEHAEQWLESQDILTLLSRVHKWQTDTWGEIPADFGRK